MDFIETAFVCALLLRIRKDWRKKRHWVHPVVSKILLNGQFYKLYEDLRNCKGNIFSYFRMSIESSDKLLVFVGPRIIYENYFAFRDLQCEVKGITIGRNIDIYDFFCCPHQMSYSSVNLTPSWNTSLDFSTVPEEFPFLQLIESFLLSIVFDIILLS